MTLSFNQDPCQDIDNNYRDNNLFKRSVLRILCKLVPSLATLLGKVGLVDSTGADITATNPLPVSASITIPGGLATEATLSNLNAKVTVCNTGNVTVSSLPLPPGAATEFTLNALNAKVTACDTGNVTITNAAGASAVNIQDGGNSITVDGAITSTFNTSNLSAFGTLETAELTPVVQGDFVYGLNSQMWNTPVTSGVGASVDTNAGRLRIQSGTGAAGYAYITSRRIIRYRAGQGTNVRFTPVYSAGVADNIQIWGVGELSSNLPYDGYFFGFNGTSFGIVHYNGSSIGSWTAQGSWNGDRCDGSPGTSFTYNPLFGTPAMIKYPFLGYGDIFFYLQNPSTGAWVLCHTIRYANTTATLEATNPSVRIVGYTLNTGNTTNKTLYCGSVGAFISGVRSFTGNPKWSMNSSLAGVTTEACILNIRNATTYNGIPNRGLIRLSTLSVGATTGSSSASSIRLKINATLGGVPAFATINGTTADSGVTITNGNSIASYDVAGTTVAGGTFIFSLALATGVNAPAVQVVDLTPYELFISPTEVLTISGQSTNSATFSVALSWSEDI